jgi:hypothetical protein
MATTADRQAVDLERVTKRFGRRYDAAHAGFAQAITGLPDGPTQRWYASVVLNRLMFACFIQPKGLLNGDPEYLRHQLETSLRQGQDRFYCGLLRPLFFEGLGLPPEQRSSATVQAIGNVPYLNGGLFRPHQIEREYHQLDIPDQAFLGPLDLFDTYEWVLEARTEDQITPQILGSLFERSINAKQIGAHYTRADVTEYIATASIIPALFGRADARLPPNTTQSLLRTLLSQEPDRSFFADATRGIALDLPPLVAAGLSDSTQRHMWNTPAPEQYGLTAETWRETIARRGHTRALRDLLTANCTIAINDLLAANLDLQRVAQDVIGQTESPEQLLIWWEELCRLSVLDPTCGSGAFLFAALEVLQPLYSICLNRIEYIVRNGAGSAAALAALERVLDDAHPNREYFVLKTIMHNNLYGVDMMEEAVEICKLQLLLKLVAQIERNESLSNPGPLPSLANIRAGNALVGYGARPNDADGRDSDSLSHALAAEYGIPSNDHKRYQSWHTSHAPFHWCAVFDMVMQNGGFDVVIGNPPYVGYSKVRNDYTVQGYATLECANLYAFTIERSLGLLREDGRLGMIVPIASLATDGMRQLQELYRPFRQWHSHWAVRPGKLFDGVDMNLTISLLQKTRDETVRYTTGYRRWSGGALGDRQHLFSTIIYTQAPILPGHSNEHPKLGSALELGLLRRMLAPGRKLRSYTAPEGVPIYYHSGGRYWRKALLEKLSSHYKPIVVQRQNAPVIFALLNSQLFYWYWISNSNCMDVVSREVLELPVFALEDADAGPFRELQAELLQSYYASTSTRTRQGDRINTEEVNFDVQQAKPIIDRIDTLLAYHYGFSDRELDFILTYDIKYRVRET